MATQADATRVSFNADALEIEWPGGTRSEFPSIWLRDNSPANRDAQSGQRLVDVMDLPAAPKIQREIVPT